MTTTSSITSATGTETSSLLGTKQTKADTNMFLDLLTAQLKNQTPLSPVDDQSFMNQMASYSSIEQQQSLNKNLLQLLDYQGALARVQGLSEGTSLLGKDVTYADAEGRTQHGTVDSVFIDEAGTVKLKLSGGNEIEMRSVLGITNQGTGSPTSGNTGSGSTGTGTSGSGSSSTGSGSTTTGTGTTAAARISSEATASILENLASATA